MNYEHVICQEKDKDNNQYTVNISPFVKKSRVADFIYSGWLEALKNRHIRAVTTYELLLETNSVFLTHNNELVSCSLFSYAIYEELTEDNRLQKNKIVNIEFSYTKPNFRKKGLTLIVFKYVEKIARINNCKFIRSYVHVDNIAQINAANSQGRKIVFHQFQKDL
jgi:hypothetical protein